MVLGLGSGSTAAFAIEALAARIASGLRIVGIPTSAGTAALARQLGVPLASFAEHRRIDVTNAGAHPATRPTPTPVKGPGGARLRQKIRSEDHRFGTAWCGTIRSRGRAQP